MAEYKLKGLHCKACVAKISETFTAAGVNAEVTLNPPLLRVTGEHPPSREQLGVLVRQAGDYSLDEANPPNPSQGAPSGSESPERLLPLGVVLAYITGGTALAAWSSGDYSTAALLNRFMGLFFLVFSAFKLLNLSGFADAYASYDIIARRSRAYALAYPFLELGLGVLYLTETAPALTNVLTLLVMSVGSIGVWRALRSGSQILCACLGTALNLPMTKVTLAEDLLMAAMAMVMLVMMAGASA